MRNSLFLKKNVGKFIKYEIVVSYRKAALSMLCEKILGSINDEAFKNCEKDYVEIEWHEAFKKLHRKVTQGGRDIGIRLDNDILTRGLNTGDVLYHGENYIIAVKISACEVIKITVDAANLKMIAKICYEIGNRHAVFFYGDEPGEFITAYNAPTLAMLEKLEGVKTQRCMYELDFEKKISTSINQHSHGSDDGGYMGDGSSHEAHSHAESSHEGGSHKAHSHAENSHEAHSHENHEHGHTHTHVLEDGTVVTHTH